MAGILQLVPERESTRLDELAREVAADTARVANLELEVRTVRERLHTLESDRVAVRLLAVKVDALTTELSELAGDLRTLGRRAMERPTPAGLSATASWVSVLIAVAALIIAGVR